MCLHYDKGVGTNYISMFEIFSTWQEQAEKLKNGEITKEEYDHWRYNYPEDLAANLKNTLDYFWDKAQKENKKRGKNYNPYDEPQEDFLARVEQIKKEHYDKENKDE